MIEKANAESKWVLVNIQQAEVFASHQLNRDIWSHDTIKDIVTTSFVFWQRDDKSTEGQQFCQHYKCGHQLPHICIIDPRTGRCVKSWDGRKWLESQAAVEAVFDFLDNSSKNFSLPREDAPSLCEKSDPVGSPDSDMCVNTVAPATNGTCTTANPTTPSAEEPSTMPEEPAENIGHIKVCFRVPSGSNIKRRFLPSATIETMLATASALTDKPMSRIDLATTYPKRLLRDIDGGLQTSVKDAQVADNVVLVRVREA